MTGHAWMYGLVYKRVLRGLGANFYGQAVTAIVQLVGIPILLRAWGVELYGEWLVVIAIPSYLSLSELGFSESAANDMAAQIARQERETALTIFQSLSMLVFPVSAVGLILVSIGLVSLPIQHWFHFSAMSIVEVRWVLWFFAVDILLRLSQGVGHAVLRAEYDYPLYAFIYVSTILMQNVWIWCMAAIGFGPVVAAGGVVAVRIAAIASVALVVFLRHSWVRLGFQAARWSELRRLSRPAFANLSMPLSQAFSIQGAVILIGALLGAPAVTVFVTLRTLSRMVFQAVVIVFNATEPELARGYGLRQYALLKDLFIHATRLGFWLALAAAVVLEVFGSHILNIWTHGQVPMDRVLFRWLLLSAVASSVWFGSLTTLKSANLHMRAAIMYGVSAAAALALAGGILAATRRLADVGLALLLIDVITGYFAIRDVSRMFGTCVVPYLLDAGNPLPGVRMVLRKMHGH